MSKAKKQWIQDEPGGFDAKSEVETYGQGGVPVAEARRVPSFPGAWPVDDGPAWFRLVKVPNSGGCLAIEKLEGGKVTTVHQQDIRAIALSKVQNFLLEELMR